MATPTRYVAVALSLLAAPLQAATIPYSENFDDDTLGSSSPSEPTPESGTFSTSGSTWSVVADGIAGQSYNFTSGTGNTSFGSSVDFVGSLGGAAATAEGFIVSSQLRFNSGSADNPLAGIGALGTSSTFATGYFADISRNGGTIRIVESGNEIAGTALDAGTVTLGETFTLTLQGVYIDTNNDQVNDALELTASVSGTGLSGSTTYTDSTPVTTGTRFGYRHRNSTAGSDINVDMDNFSVTAVPEPGSALVAGLAAGSLLLRRRKRA